MDFEFLVESRMAWMILNAIRFIALFCFIFIAACTADKGDLKGYVGNDSGSSSDGSTRPSNAVIMLPSTPQVTVTEGSTAKLLVLFNRPLPRAVTLNWQLADGDKDFEVASGVISAAEEAESIEINLKVKSDGLYEGEEKFFVQLSGDTNVFLSSLMYPVIIPENGSGLLISILGPGTPGSKTQQLNENAAAGGTDVFVRQSSAADFPVQVQFTVTGNATSGGDFSLSEAGSVTFAPGETVKKIRFNVVNDSLNESPESVVITLNSVAVGSLANIDNDNKMHTINIVDDDLGSRFEILGVRGGADNLLDTYLTSGVVPQIEWSNALDEQEYKISVKNSSSSVVCSDVIIAADTLNKSFGPSDCAGYVFLQGEEYTVVAEVKVAGVYYPASNSGVFKFFVDGTPPGTFEILGVFGGDDIEPDQYLAGTLNPSVSWQNASGEVGYRIGIYSRDSGVEVCAPVVAPANVTSISFQSCPLVRGAWYKATVVAFDSANNLRPAGNTNFEFFVTEVASGFVIAGVTGGTADVTADTNLNDAGEIGDPYAFNVNWNTAGGIDRYEVTILNANNTLKCPTVTVMSNQAKISGCRLDLNFNYKVRVVGFDINGVQYPATNSPMPFVFRKGLFLSGDATIPSYYRGIPITNCGGGATCNSTNPYVVTTAFQEEQIVVGKDAVLTGPAWAGGPVDSGNGRLEITADILRIEDNGRIIMDGRGYTSSSGEGHGVDGASSGTGAAHGGNGTRNSVDQSGKAYGSAKNPTTMGSGGGAAGATPGGKGGGVIKLVVNDELAFKSGTISSLGANGSGQSGGGAGGSILLNAKKVSGISGVISVKGGTGGGGAGSGGRVALYYQEVTHSGGLAGITFTLLPGADGGASGTLFTKNTKTVGGDTFGYLMIDLGGTFRQARGVETPLPLFDSADPSADKFDAIYSKGQATYIVEATKSYTLQSSATPPTLDYRVVAEGDFQVPTGTTFKIGGTGYFEWRKSAPINMFTDLIVSTGGVLTHTANQSAKNYNLDIQVNNLILQGTISVDGKGYSPSNGAVGGVGSGVEGAGYGGQGGYYANIANRGTANGKIKEPDSLGSASAVAAGGGVVKLVVANEFTLGGAITANGQDGCGGGAGGSIWVQTNKLLGNSGTISSQGGGSYTGMCGGGGGGRIAVYYNSTTYTGGITGVKFLVAGGDAFVDGAAGTIYHKKTAGPSADIGGHLMVLNGTRNYNEDVVTPIYSVNGDQMDSVTTDARGTILVSSEFSGSSYILPSDKITYRVVAEGDFALPSGGHLQVMDGGYLEVRRNTPYTFNKLTVSQNGFLTHSTNKDGVKRYLLHFILANFDLDGVVDVSGRGYPASTGPGTTTLSGYGAGHGGYGGNSGVYVTQTGGAPYQENKIKEPDDFGSGSAPHSAEPTEAIGVPGGGLAKFEISDNFKFSGQILADGRTGVCSVSGSTCSGGASGGSIYIITESVSGGNGTLSANGGSGGGTSNSGSGGRIAFVYENDTQYLEGTIRNLVNYEKIRAFGGTSFSSRAGAAGSIFLRDSDSASNINGDLIYNNSNNLHPQKTETLAPQVPYDSIKTLNNATLLVPAGQTFTLPENLDYRIVVEGTAVFQSNLTIKNKGYLEWRKSSQVALTNLTIEPGGLLTHSRNYTTVYNDEVTNKDYRLDFDVTNNFTLNGGGIVDVSGRGYQRGNGAGTGSGAAYGGKSGSGANPYGSYNNPSNHGSGSNASIRGSGGGVARFKVGGTTTLNGTILANADGESGSGGTIKLDTGVLSGVTGSLRANGGNGSAGGSGGRISILYTTDNYPLSYLTMSAYGGDGAIDGAAGTIFYKQSAAAYGNLIVNNAGRTYDPDVTTVLPQDQLDSVVVDSNSGVEVKAGETVRLPNSSVSYKLIVAGNIQLPLTSDTLVVEDGGILELKKSAVLGSKTAGLGNVRNITVKPQGLLRQALSANNNSITPDFAINLDLDKLIVQGTLDAYARGPVGGTGSVGGSASHGGRGTGSFINNIVENFESLGIWVYGSIKNPITAGSGFGGNRGGGLILLNVNQLDLSGRINASGVDSSYGGGAGGSVNIEAVEIKSTGGIVSARGGTGGSNVGGGGGRIAVRCTGTLNPQCTDLETLNLDARGGAFGAISGGAGTIYIKGPSDSNGRLILNNGNNGHQLGAEAVINETLDFDSVTIGSATTGVYVPSGIVATFSSSEVFFPLRLRGDVRFPGATASPTFDLMTEHWGNVRVVEGGRLYFHRVQNFNSSFAIVDRPFIYFDFIMEPGSFATHIGNTTSAIHSDLAVYIKTKNHLHLKPDSMINVSNLGYAVGVGPGAGTYYLNLVSMGPPINKTINFQNIPVGSGGSYGGKGGGLIRYLDGTSQPVVGYVAPSGNSYGDPQDPRLPGSGGGCGISNTSRGGGVVILQSENLMTLEGSILANGENGPYSAPSSTHYGCGGGSGGSINIITNVLAGSYATIQARGGSAGAAEVITSGGGGSGGRVAIVKTTNNYNGLLVPDVSGGAAFDDTGQPNYVTESPPTMRAGQDGTSYVSP